MQIKNKQCKTALQYRSYVQMQNKATKFTQRNMHKHTYKPFYAYAPTKSIVGLNLYCHLF